MLPRLGRGNLLVNAIQVTSRIAPIMSMCKRLEELIKISKGSNSKGPVLLTSKCAFCKFIIKCSHDVCIFGASGRTQGVQIRTGGAYLSARYAGLGPP
eukprot:1372669-Amphidinium_carterae.1